MWEFHELKKINSNNGLLIVGLPGMGNVGKITGDFITESLKATKICEISSDSLPHCVFVNESHEVVLPQMNIFYKKHKSKSLFLLVGDVQPLESKDCYSFCEEVLKFCKKHKIKEIITLGGIGLSELPEEPKLFCAGTDSKIIKKLGVNSGAYGVVGPIIGVSGLLIGLAKEKNIGGIVLLSETFGHPNYLGIKGSKELLKHLNSKLSLGIKMDTINKEIKEIEAELLEKIEQLNVIQEETMKKSGQEYTNYIG